MKNRSASPHWSSKGWLAVVLAATATMLAFEPWQWWVDDTRMQTAGVLNDAGSMDATAPLVPPASHARTTVSQAVGHAALGPDKVSGRRAVRRDADVAALALEPTGAIQPAESGGATAPQGGQAEPDGLGVLASGKTEQAYCPPSEPRPVNGLLPPFAMMVAACAVTQQMLQPVQ